MFETKLFLITAGQASVEVRVDDWLNHFKSAEIVGYSYYSGVLSITVKIKI